MQYFIITVKWRLKYAKKKCKEFCKFRLVLPIKIYYTGCPDQIGRNFKIRLLLSKKTCRKCKDSFRIVEAMCQTGFKDVKQDKINCGYINPDESTCKPFHRANCN